MGILASERFTAPRMPGRHVMVVHDPARLARRPAAARAQRRRRQVLHGLATVVALTGVAAIAWGGAFVAAFGGAAVLGAAYFGLLTQLRAVERRGRRVVRHLDAADAPRARPVSARRVSDRIA
jgi:hypothetical protein